MKKSIYFLFFSFLFQFADAQTAAVYYIEFNDKKDSQYSLNDPSAYLSAKALERRRKQNIAINSTDLPVNTAYINAIKAMDIRIMSSSKWFNTITVSCSDSSKIKQISALPFVKQVKKIETVSAATQPSKFETESAEAITLNERNESLKPVTTALNYGYSYNQAHQINVDCLHDLGYQGQGMTIAVLDAGFQDTHILPVFDSMRLNDQLLGTRDFVTGDTMVFEDFPHGMNVLSCMAGNLPGQLIGTAPKANYWLLRTEDAFSESIIEEVYWLNAAEFADSVGADIINSSLGYNYFDNSADNHTHADLDGNTTIITRAADMAASKGIFVVSSAGNYGGTTWYKIVAPADADSILTVGAVDSTGAIAALSSRGPTADGRIKPNTVARGLNAVIAGNTGGITVSSGTSFASPITAGAVACLWQSNPNATNMELLQSIQQSASMYTNPDTVKGYGIPNFCLANTLLTGIENYLIEYEELLVYPNPFDNELSVTFYSEQKQTILFRLYDIVGHEVLKMEKDAPGKADIILKTDDLPVLPQGMYIVCLTASGTHYYKKIIKK